LSGVIVIAEHLEGQLRDVSLELVSAARQLDAGPVAVVVIGADARLAAAEGVDEVIAVPGPAAYSGEVHRSLIGALIAERGPRVVIGGFTACSMSWAPALAAKNGYGFASDVVSLSSEDGLIVARREFYGAKVAGDVVFPGAETVMLLLRPTAWLAASPGGTPSVTRFQAPIAEGRERHVEYLPPPTGDVDITSADVILAIGRGVGEKDNVGQFEQLADQLGATLASSRPLVDAGWVAAERQVGQSGKTVKPRLYLALGISGAVQHLAGMKGARTIVAVNADAEAAIFHVADYGAVVDMFDVADELSAQA
jgi:electron transfer flavoprotein alpha subunit